MKGRGYNVQYFKFFHRASVTATSYSTKDKFSLQVALMHGTHYYQTKNDKTGPTKHRKVLHKKTTQLFKLYD